MKNGIISLSAIILIPLFSLIGSAQEKFDVVTFTTPKGWKKEINANAVQIGKEDAEQGTFCLITMFKALPTDSDSRTNFDAAWQTLVVETISPKAEPQMQEVTTKAGWTVESGFAQYDSDGKKGVAMLVAATGNKKVVNLLILTNSDIYQETVISFVDSINLPKITEQTNANTLKDTVNTQRKSAFQFSTSNFDDGWTATQLDDWVAVTKGQTTVYLYYYFKVPNASTIRDDMWEKVVKQRFTIISANTKRAPTASPDEWKEGEAIDKKTGKRVYLAMNWSKTLNLAVSANESESDQLFPTSNALFAMHKYNRFAIGANDLAGTWENGDSNTLDWYNPITGLSAGSTLTAISAVFNFYNNGTYKSVHNGATGSTVGNMNTFQQEYNGIYRVANWKVEATNRFQGQTDNFEAWFVGVKNGRILKLKNLGIEYSLVKTK